MNNRLWLFYPENDIALAHGNANFTAPPAAVRLRRSGELLPLWLANGGDRVMCSGVNESWLRGIAETFLIEADVWNHSDFDLLPTPWGWSQASKRVFVNAGFPADKLPDNATLDRYRELSHRRTAAQIGQRVAEASPLRMWPRAIEVFDVETLHNAIADKHTVVKAPWSSSGRGVTFVERRNEEESLRRLEGTIRRQGSVMVEEFAPNRFDFAMLFICTAGRTSYEGLSVFAADNATGQYRGNLVADEERLRGIISAHLPGEAIDALRDALIEAIDEIIAPHYEGPVGIDLLATEQNGQKLVHVVESNLRWTMGFVAKSLARFTAKEATFEVVPGDHSADCVPIVSSHKLVDGTLALTPPGGDFTFTLKINRD